MGTFIKFEHSSRVHFPTFQFCVVLGFFFTWSAILGPRKRESSELLTRFKILVVAFVQKLICGLFPECGGIFSVEWSFTQMLLLQ